MINMFVKSTVRDYDAWISVFQQRMASREAAGIFCEYIWQDPADPNIAFTLFRVDNREISDSYMANPQSTEFVAADGIKEVQIQYLHTA